MVCGTTSDSGKSTVVTGLCRLLARRGVRVAPFKAQNMALNSVITAEGHEIGRAQAVQAFAAGIEPHVTMNPVLLKPTSDRASQVVVMGEPHGVMSAREYHAFKPQLLPTVLASLGELRDRFDVVICEGAGSPAEINLLEHDIVNLRIAVEAQLAAIVVGDIDLGGVFAALFGTVALLPPDLGATVRGFVINKLRGDPALLADGCAQLEARTGVPTLGVLPWIDDAGLEAGIDAEDSIALRRAIRSRAALADGDELDIAVIALPRISNFTDIDPLACEPGVRVRFVHDVSGLGDPDLVVLPGSKATVSDLQWLRTRGLDRAIAIAARTATVLGICGGYQMLGRSLNDPVESGVGVVDGLAMLGVVTCFEASKVTRRCAGQAMGEPYHGYQIHHGRVVAESGDAFVTVLGDDGMVIVDGVRDGNVFGTTVHGIFEADAFRRAFLGVVGARRGKRFISNGVAFASIREARVDALADAMATHLDLDAIDALIAAALPIGVV